MSGKKTRMVVRTLDASPYKEEEKQYEKENKVRFNTSNDYQANIVR